MERKQKSKSDEGFLNEGACEFESPPAISAIKKKQLQAANSVSPSNKAKKSNARALNEAGCSTDQSPRPLVDRTFSLDSPLDVKQRPKSQSFNRNRRNGKEKSPQGASNQGARSKCPPTRISVAESPEQTFNRKNFASPRINKSQRKSTKFEPYLSLFEVQQGLKRGEFIEGALRINPRNYEDAYINAPDGQMDIYIGGMRDRNRALNGDLVAVKINPKQEWKVLCDAIKDYHDKHGHTIVESVPSPVSTPCRIHTPEKFSKAASKASSLWNEPGNLRMPDSLEIIGVDKLADELSKISVKPKKNRSKRCRKRNAVITATSSQDSSNQPSSTSHGSSEDILDGISPEVTPNLRSNPPVLCNFDSNNIVHIANHSNNRETETKSTTSNEVNHAGNSWEADGDTSSIFISPEMLLDFGYDNPLQQLCNQYEQVNTSSSDESSAKGSNRKVVVVAPHDLSGDEFTDSISTDTSTHHDQLEDFAFFESQQDTENNNIENVDLNNSPFNWPVSVNREEIISNIPIDTFEHSTGEWVTGESACRKELGNSHVLPAVEVVVDSETQSLLVRERQNRINFQQNEDNIECVAVHQSLSQEKSSSVDAGRNTKTTEIATRKSKKRRKFKSKKENVQQKSQGTSINLLCNSCEIESLTVEQVMQHPMWPKFVQKTGKVVFILERRHSQVAVGHIKLLQDKSSRFALFSPKDNRLPRFMIPMSDCPQNFYERPQDFAKFLFLAQMDCWQENSNFPAGRLVKILGSVKEIAPQTEGMLSEYGVDSDDFSSSVVACLPNSKKWAIPKSELSKRVDFCNTCVFTIDPPTARDMDDAVSCELLPNGNFEIGVHIADVSYFVTEGSPLDECAKSRATSVYLVQKVIPMLPRVLCDELCSLNPGKDRLTFSVSWEITPDAEVLSHKFQRSVINSCIKLSYNHAQEMIENPGKQWHPEEHPPLYGQFQMHDVVRRVLLLNVLAVKLRKKRFDGGALQLNQTKLQFTLNESGLPSGFSAYEQKDSNRLIEEFMLLANMTVAKQIYDVFPHLSMLRQHPPPQVKPLEDVVKACASMGLHLDASSSGALQSSLENYHGSDELSKMRNLVLTHLCSKPMNCARYICTGVMKSEEKFHHYALCVPFYTHFTSPIRRYPDIIVHRLLGASLYQCPVPMLQPNQMQKIAEHCNDKKLNAKRVSELSDELFLAAFLQECGPVNVQAMVISVMDHSFDCLVFHYGIVKRVYCDKLKQTHRRYEKINGVPSLTLIWKDAETPLELTQKIIMFAIVELSLFTSDEMSILAKLQFPPRESQPLFSLS